MPSVCAAVILRSGAVLLGRRAGRWELPSTALRVAETPQAAGTRLLLELGLTGAVGAETARVRFGETEIVALLVSGVTGKPPLPGCDETAWVEARRLLERELSPETQPVAEVLAAHRRRERYSSTHPKTFAQKYKELGGDPDAIAKAKARGSTPAGAHLPIMVAEVLEALEPLGGAAVLDCTLGFGGHAAELAHRAGPRGRVIGLDRDGEELARTQARLRQLGLPITARQTSYAGARRVLNELGVAGVDALLADLGVSSMQLDRPERGMSFKNDGPLDMRMDRSRGETAAQWLAVATEGRIEDALARFGDEPDAAKIAAALVALRGQGRLPQTTRELAAAVAAAKGLGEGRVVKKDAFSAHPATRTFQALRIAVNDEREELEALLRDLPALMKPGGRAAFLTFHSGEEKLLQAALRAQAAAGLWRAAPEPPRKPSPEEVRQNPRARSARLWRVVRA